MAGSNPPPWEAPKFSFNIENQAAEWKQFYIRAIDYLEALHIDPEKEDETKQGWYQIKMMSQGEDRQALQSLLSNNTITTEDQLILPEPLKQCRHQLRKMNISGILEMNSSAILGRNHRKASMHLAME